MQNAVDLHAASHAERSPIDRLLAPVRTVLHSEASGGVLLLVATVIALIWANSSLSDSYGAVFGTYVTVGAGAFEISKPLLLWINDGLMAVFFLLVGLEIKREVLAGHLSSPKQAALTVVAAVGGMAVPAAIYAVMNAGGEGIAGWGVPMATDIAFALGVLSIVGRRAPLALKVFLTAVAIVDDIGAVLVIAFFYTSKISSIALLAGAGFLALLVLANRLGVRSTVPYVILGIALWVAFLKSGVHATIAGVLLAFTIPAGAQVRSSSFVEWLRGLSGGKLFSSGADSDRMPDADYQHALSGIVDGARSAGSPLRFMEHALHPWVAFFIMPVFALANAGVAVGGGFLAKLMDPVALGIAAGLIVGKQGGIMLAVWGSVKTGIAALPAGMTWMHAYGVASLAGIGFTMSMFIANLAFPGSELLDTAKVGILSASLVSGIIGAVVLKAATRDA